MDRMSGEAELQMPEFAAGEVASRRRWKRFNRWELYVLGVAAVAWVGWMLWGWLG